jgi:hypothetical protein
MYGYMSDHLSILKDRLAKAEAKVQRHKKSLESAESELSDLMTAMRVMEEIANGGDSNTAGTPTTIGRQLDIVKLLPVGRKKGASPADLYASYNLYAGENITIDTFRTTLWRMKDKSFEMDSTEFVVHGDAGVYWKEHALPPEPPEPDYDSWGTSAWNEPPDEEPLF